MLAWWTQILPVFVFKWLARKHCERFSVFDRYWAEARKDVLVLTHDLHPRSSHENAEVRRT